VTSSGIQAIAESRDGIVIGTRIKLLNQARPRIAVRQGQIIAADARHAEPLTGAGHEQAASLPKIISSFSFERFDGGAIDINCWSSDGAAGNPAMR
jgi:hypothetical protein